MNEIPQETQVNAYQTDIPKHLQRELRQARHDITLATANFSNPELFRVFCQQAASGVPVKLALCDTPENRSPKGYSTQPFIESGGKLFWIPATDPDLSTQQPYCLLDRHIVITGSYQWGKPTQQSLQDIVVISGATEFALQYLENFNRLILRHGYEVQAIPRLDTEAVIRRLDLIRQFISLGDFDDVRTQLQKLRMIHADPTLLAIISDLEQQRFKPAVDNIIAYTAQLRAIAVYRDPDIERFKQELRALEYQITALSDQKSEVERLINDFLHQHHHRLGKLIAHYLLLRRLVIQQRIDELLKTANADKRTIDTLEQAQEEFNKAQEEEAEYQEHYQELEQQPGPPPLSDEQQTELKQLYKKASMLCHPDRVSEDHKAEAHALFIQLQAAYQQNDLDNVRAIYQRLKHGQLFADQSTALNESQALQQAIASLHSKLKQLRGQLHGLMQTETWQTISQLTDWDGYFTDKQKQLEAEIADLDQALTTPSPT